MLARMPDATNIHPSAIIDPSAKIGTGVEIGPYCVIYAGVEIGDGCWLQNHVTIDGPTKIGSGNRFYAFGSIGQRTQDLKYSGEPTYLEIGDNNCFRESVTVNRGTDPGSYTRIGSGGNFLAYSHVAHDCSVGDNVIFSNNGTLAGHVDVGEHAILGGLSAVHQFCRIGRHSLVGGCTKIVQDLPPFMIADGNAAEVRGINAVGLHRHGFAEDSILALKKAYRVIYKRNLNVADAVAQLKETHPEQGGDQFVRELIDFIEASERGIIR